MTNKIKSDGPRTEPWWAPRLIRNEWLWESRYRTFHLLSDKMYRVQRRKTRAKSLWKST